jgi:hypothetical protein
VSVTAERVVRLINIHDPELQTVAKHESAHVAAAAAFGWEPYEAELYPDGAGDCHMFAPADISRSQRLEEYAVISLAARSFIGRTSGDGADLAEASTAIRELAQRKRLPAGWLRRRLQQRADELATSREFVWIASYVADALLQRGRLGPLDIAQVIREARRDCANRQLGVQFTGEHDAA